MDYSRIKLLLEKYWICATTVEEERELRYFFSGETIPPELCPYKAWFLTDDAERLPPLGKEFDLKVLQRISQERRFYRRRLLYTVLLLIGFIFLLLCLIYSGLKTPL